MDAGEFFENANDAVSSLVDPDGGKVYVYMGDGTFRPVLDVSISESDEHVVLSLGTVSLGEDEL